MKKAVFLLPVFVLCAGIVACAPVTLLNKMTPSGGFSKTGDIAFAKHERLKLDIYQPDDGPDNQPVVVFVHGGSWSRGDKDMYKFIGDALTAEGLTAVIPNYRLHPGILFPDPVVDTARAVAWTARKFPDQPIVLMGHSAGAYNILMSAMDPQYLSDQGIETCRHIASVISLAGPVGIVSLKEEPYITIFPERFTGKDAPLNQEVGPMPPLLLINGDKDKSVSPKNATALAEKVTQEGGAAKARIYPGVNHIDPVKYFSRYFDGDSTIKSDVLAFIREHSKPSDNYCP